MGVKKKLFVEVHCNTEKYIKMSEEILSDQKKNEGRGGEGEKKIVINRQTLMNSFVLEYEFYFVICKFLSLCMRYKTCTQVSKEGLKYP